MVQKENTLRIQNLSIKVQTLNLQINEAGTDTVEAKLKICAFNLKPYELDYIRMYTW